MATWLSGVVSNHNQMDADGHFAWVGPFGYSDHTHFTWKQQMVPVDWVRQIPKAAIEHAEAEMNNFLDWVKPGWELGNLKARINTGFGSDWKSDPHQLFRVSHIIQHLPYFSHSHNVLVQPKKESPNTSISFLKSVSMGLVGFADMLKRELATQSRLVVVIDGQAELMQGTRDEFFIHASGIVKVRLLSSPSVSIAYPMT
jgi:hypothetical protein